MTETTITVPSAYGYVILSSVVLPWFFTTVTMSKRVMQAREIYNVQYPNLYGVPGYHKKADEFNRVQRGHQNVYEHITSFTVMSLIGGLKHPIMCAVGGVCYSMGIYLYQAGYSDNSADVKNARHGKGGLIKYIGIFGSLGSCVSVAATMCGWI